MTGRPLRCAVYTRKSSEEGLDQSFNSIDAQREACEAYVLSQRHEGWTVVPTRYDDGGFSGGTLDRPAVQQLLTDIRTGLVDLIVVYKIDRLTRSLADFAKMVEVFDAHGTSFVSVTQHFNTTSSMGRLTLNVLLSFAQFEREVTGERIRDKIAASKKRGMWMGGIVPLGYDAVDRKLVVNPEEADLVKRIHEMYVASGNVREVQVQLQVAGLVSKIRTSRGGRTSGGGELMRGALYKILRSRVYLGEVPHKDAWYPGEHEAIVDIALFDEVQKILNAGLDRRNRGLHAQEPSLLTGWIHDQHGFPLTPSHALKKGKRYRYYVSRPQLNGVLDKTVARVSLPAHDVEQLVVETVARWLGNAAEVMNGLRLTRFDPGQRNQVIARAEQYAEKLRQATMNEQRGLLLPCVARIQVNLEDVAIELQSKDILAELAEKVTLGKEGQDHLTDVPVTLKVAAQLKRLGMEMRLVVEEQWAKVEEPTVDQHLVLGLARAHGWWRRLCAGEAGSIAELAAQDDVEPGYVAKMLRGALLAPDLVEQMMEGEALGFSSKRLMEPVEADWRRQRKNAQRNASETATFSRLEAPGSVRTH